MRRRQYGRKGVLALALLVLLAGRAETAEAYFTTYAEAEGGRPIVLGPRTEIREQYEDWVKHITVDNVGDAACYVRVKVFAGSQVPVTVRGEGWTQDAASPETWYYGEAVPAGGSTERELRVEIGPVPEPVEGFNVVVLEECAPVLYDGAGNALPAASAEVWAQSFETEEGGA